MENFFFFFQNLNFIIISLTFFLILSKLLLTISLTSNVLSLRLYFHYSSITLTQPTLILRTINLPFFHLIHLRLHLVIPLRNIWLSHPSFLHQKRDLIFHINLNPHFLPNFMITPPQIIPYNRFFISPGLLTSNDCIFLGFLLNQTFSYYWFYFIRDWRTNLITLI